MGCDARSSASNHMAIFVHMSTPLTWQTFHLLQWQTSDVFFCYFVATFDTLWFYRIVDVDDKMMECYLMLWNIPLIHSQEQSVLNNVNLLSWAGDQMMNVPLANISSLNPFKWQRIPKQVPKRWQKRGENCIKSQFKHKHTVCSASTNTNSVRLFIWVNFLFAWLIRNFRTLFGCEVIININTSIYRHFWWWWVVFHFFQPEIQLDLRQSTHSVSSGLVVFRCFRNVRSIGGWINLFFFVAKLPFRKWLIFKHQTVC